MSVKIHCCRHTDTYNSKERKKINAQIMKRLTNVKHVKQ